MQVSRPHPSAARVAPLAATLAAFLLGACRGAPAPLPAPRVAADSARADTVAPGVVHRTWYVSAGPWVVHALDVDRRGTRGRCWAPVALKAGGRGPARALLSDLAAAERARRGPGRLAGAVNADFFLFAPDGLPTSAHVRDGEVLFGPAARDVFAVDRDGRLHVTRLEAAGWLVAGRDSVRLGRWNRVEAGAVSLVDPSYGERVDSARLGLAVPLRSIDGGRAAFGGSRWTRLVADTALGPGAPAPRVPRDGALVVAGRGTPDSVRAALLRIGRARDTVRLRVALSPFHPREAVGGNGVLLARGQVPARLDSVGNAGFRNRNPRTAVGFTRDGRRLFYVVVDGRQPGYSAGMTLRELAAFMRDLGAHEALNLDGGGSSAMVVPDLRGDTAVTIVNRPSDKTERRVANGVAVANTCTP